jgi:hypothetical protein
MSQSTDEQITQLLSTLKKSIQSRSSKMTDGSDSELEYEINDITEVEDNLPVTKNVKQKKSVPEEPVGTVSHQKYCIKCGSADNLFRNNKYKTCVVCCSKHKKPGQSENQKKAFEKCRAKRLENVEKRKAALKEFEQKVKGEMDSKVVKKAINIKKRSIIREAQLEESDEEDTPLEEVIKIAKKTEAKKRAPRKVKNPEQEIEKEIEQPIQQQYYAPSFSFA